MKKGILLLSVVLVLTLTCSSLTTAMSESDWQKYSVAEAEMRRYVESDPLGFSPRAVIDLFNKTGVGVASIFSDDYLESSKFVALSVTRPADPVWGRGYLIVGGYFSKTSLIKDKSGKDVDDLQGCGIVYVDGEIRPAIIIPLAEEGVDFAFVYTNPKKPLMARANVTKFTTVQPAAPGQEGDNQDWAILWRFVFLTEKDGSDAWGSSSESIRRGSNPQPAPNRGSATDAPSMWDFFEKDENGWLIPRKDIRSMLPPNPYENETASTVVPNPLPTPITSISEPSPTPRPIRTPRPTPTPATAAEDPEIEDPIVEEPPEEYPVLGGGTERELPSDWAKPEVDQAITNGLVPLFLRSRYTSPITRAEFAAVATTFYELLMGPIVIGEGVSFIDTSDPNVLKTATIGVVQGVGGGRFDPDAEITREQSATMLYRLADACGFSLPSAFESHFADSEKIANWALPAVNAVVAAGIMKGTGDGIFSPDGPYTREQTYLTIDRLDGWIKVGHKSWK